MANEKIINLDNLKKFRQEYDTRISGGAIPVGKALTAKQLEPVSEESGSEQTAPFLFQATGTDNNTTETPTAPIAKHLELRGNSVVWIQLAKEPISNNYNTENNNRTFDSSDNSSTYTFTEDSQTTGARLYTNYDVYLPTGHKILIKLKVTSSQAVSDDRFNLYILRGWTTFGNNYYSLNANEEKEIWEIFEVPADSETGKFQFRAFYRNNGTWLQGTTIKYKDVQIFDLTDIYGAGKEPTIVLQFNRDYPLPYYSYNARTLKSCKTSALEDVKQNQFQELNAFIEVIAGTKYYISGISAGGYIEEYDGAKNLIKTSSEITSATTIELSENTHYVKVQATTYTDIMLCIYWGIGEDYSHKPYGKYRYTLPEVELRSAGNIYDTIIPNGTRTQRISVPLKLSTLTASRYGTSSHTFWLSSISDLKTSLFSNVANILCNEYITLSETQAVSSQINGICVHDVQHRFIITDDRFDATTEEGIALFQAHLDNVYAQYELETPIVSEVSSFTENINVDDMGTMKFVPSADNLEPIIPQGNKFFYPIDVSMFIDDLYKRSKDGGTDANVNNLVVKSELEQAISEIPTPDVEGALNVINASDITSNTLSAEQYALIRNGKPTLIKGTFLNMLNPILLTSSYLETFGMIIGANSSGNYTAIKYYEIYASGSNYIIQIYGNKRIEFSNLYSINGKEIPNYPSNTGTFVLKCVDGTLTWVAE